MRFHDSTLPNVTKVLSRDASRPVLTMAYLDTTRAVLEATDSYKLVSVPVDVEAGDVSGFIPPQALVAYYKAAKAHRYGEAPRLESAEQFVWVHAGDGGSQSWPRENPGQWVKSEQLIPGEADRSGFKVRLNAKFLLELAQALGGEEVTIQFVRAPNTAEEGEGCGYFPANLRPMLVFNGAPDHGTGLLMPIRLNA